MNSATRPLFVHVITAILKECFNQIDFLGFSILIRSLKGQSHQIVDYTRILGFRKLNHYCLKDSCGFYIFKLCSSWDIKKYLETPPMKTLSNFGLFTKSCYCSNKRVSKSCQAQINEFPEAGGNLTKKSAKNCHLYRL
jgi:hypothetical protein